jgi:hypothetical protein
MPKTSKETAPDLIVTDGYEGHQEKLEGGFFISIETYTQDWDLSSMFKGLPGDMCTCKHWGYVLAGEITYKSPRGDETFRAGDAFYVQPGHTHVMTKDSAMVEFSLTGEHDVVADAVIANMRTAGIGVTKD